MFQTRIKVTVLISNKAIYKIQKFDISHVKMNNNLNELFTIRNQKLKGRINTILYACFKSNTRLLNV
jgi:hypothetical protein